MPRGDASLQIDYCLEQEKTMTSSKRRIHVGLINLRATNDDWTEAQMVPLGLMYLSSSLKAAYGEDVHVSLHDMTLTPSGESLEDSVEGYLRAESPHIVGIRGFTTQAESFLVVARCVKRVHPDCLVIVGGPHANTLARQLFEEQAIDLVALQEGEETIIEIVANVLAGRDHKTTPGLAWMQDGKPALTIPRPPIADLDKLSFPDYEILDLDAYQGKTMACFPPRGRYTSLFTSRGCHYRCTYCHDNFGKRVRYRSIQNVLDEMAYLIEEHGVRDFHIIDDIFNADRRRAIEIFEGVIRRNWDVGFAFSNGLRADIMNQAFIDAAKAAGTYYWALAVETATPRIQKMVKKFNRLDRVFETIGMGVEAGVVTATFNMLGFPTETEEEMDATIRFNIESDAHMALYFKVTPFAGTGLFNQVQQTTDVVPPTEMVSGFVGQRRNDRDQFTTIPDTEIQKKIDDATRRFYVDPRRVQLWLDLVTRHGYAPVRVLRAFEDRLLSHGISDEHVRDPEVRTMVGRMYSAAGERSVLVG